jgi:hypothetical protein
MLAVLRHFTVCHTKKFECENGVGEVVRVPEYRNKVLESDYEVGKVLGFPGSFGEVVSCVHKHSKKGICSENYEDVLCLGVDY